MMIARWRIDARFGHKDAALAMMQRWWRDIAPQIGWSAEQVDIYSGALGVAESAIEVQIRVKDLVELHSAWERLTEIPDQKRWIEELAPHVVSGSARWTVLREVAVASGEIA